jgi:hypothetical protein
MLQMIEPGNRSEAYTDENESNIKIKSEDHNFCLVLYNIEVNLQNWASALFCTKKKSKPLEA